MKSSQLTHMAKMLATISATNRDTDTDWLLDVLLREAATKGIPLDEITAAREMYTAKTAKGKQECLDSQLMFECLRELNSSICEKESEQERKELFELYSTLLDYWADHPDDSEYEEQHICANCFWLSPEGRRCGCMTSGFFPDCMEDTETCVEWTAKD